MKNCYKPMLVCVGIALAAIVILPRFGIQIAGASVLFGLVMIACCALPMIFMMSKASSGDGKGSCCGGEKNKAQTEEEKKAQSTTSQKPACH